MSKQSSIEDLIEEFQKSQLQNIVPKEITITKNMIANEDIPSIPDIEELQDSNTTQAPLLDPVKVSTYDELGRDLQRQSISALPDIDLSLLINQLNPDNIMETDIVWTIDSLVCDLIQQATHE